MFSLEGHTPLVAADGIAHASCVVPDEKASFGAIKALYR